MPYANPEDRKQYHREWYRRNRDKVIAASATYRVEHPEKAAEWRAVAKARHHDSAIDKNRRSRKWFWRNLALIKQAQGCTDCGVKHGKLNYHHLDPATKRTDVSKMYAYSIEAFIDEIGKCVLVCNACHAKRHATKSGVSNYLCSDAHWATCGEGWPD